jgi:uncharacterized protein (DUF1501 family)
MDLRQVGKTILTQHIGFDLAAVERDVFPGSSASRPIDGLIRT